VNFIVSLAALTLVAADPRPSAIPPQARDLNDRAVRLIEQGEYQAAVTPLMQAYAAMPDALGQREGRGKVPGTLRSTLRRLYDTTGDLR